MLTCARRTLPHHRAWQDGFSGLYLASREGHVEVVKLLLGSKAEANRANKVLNPLPSPAVGFGAAMSFDAT